MNRAAALDDVAIGQERQRQEQWLRRQVEAGNLTATAAVRAMPWSASLAEAVGYGRTDIDPLIHDGPGFNADRGRAPATAADDQTRMWPVDVDVHADARAQARPFTGDDMNAEDRAWSARVDAAVQGMDIVDPVGLDAWMQGHADSATPHVDEAELVAVWETHVRDHCANAEASADEQTDEQVAEQGAQAGAADTAPTTDVPEVAEVVDVDSFDDADGW